MNTKKILQGSLLAGGVLALIRLASARAFSAKPASKPCVYAAIDAYLEEQMRRLRFPGAALAIVEGDQIVHMRGFGRSRPGGEAPSPETPFFIGSLTKSITAMAVMQLVEAGKVDLDAPVQRYLPWFRAQVKDSRAPAQVTVRHLLNQTGGLPLGPGWELSADFDDCPGATERQSRSLFPLKLTRSPGAAFEYSNLNFNLLGLIIEAVSGESYPAYIQNHIFNPLEMRHSHTSKAAAKRDGLAVGHQSWFGVPVAVPDLPVSSGSLPSGQLISSAEDLGHYLIAYLNGGRYGETQILSPEGIVELHRPAVETMVLGYERGWYGMGWYIAEQGQMKACHHSGLTPDFFAYMALLPAQKKGVVLLVNADHFMMQPMMAEVDAGLTRLLAGNPPAPIRLGVIPWLLRGLLLIPFLQIIDVAATLGFNRGWRKDPQRRPSDGRVWGQHILLPLIPNLLAALTLIPALGHIRKFLMLFAPDFSWIARICGGFAGIWMFLRTELILRSLRSLVERCFIRSLCEKHENQWEDNPMPEIITHTDAQYALDIVKMICAEVSPGLPGSSQECERANMVRKELETHLGAENVIVEEFTLAPGGFLNPYSGLFLLFAVLLNLSINRFTGISPWVTTIAALALSILSPLLFTIEFMLGKEFVDPFLKQKQSQNVIGRLRKPGTIAVKRLLILSGHHDSAPENICLCLLSFINRLLTPKGQRESAQEDTRLRILGYVFYFLSATFFLGLILMLVMNIIQLTGVITSNAGIVRAGTLGWVLTVYPILPAILFGLFSVKRGKDGGTVPGAVDNLAASALAVAMSRFLAKNPDDIPDNTEIRFISFGSEEAGLRGSRRYVKRHLNELKQLDARLLNIEMVAHPEIYILTSDVNGTVKNSPGMVKSVVAAAKRAGVPYKVSSASIGVGSDAAPFTQAGLKATTLLPFRVPQQTVAFYHQRWDTPDQLTIEPLLNVLRLSLVWLRSGGD